MSRLLTVYDEAQIAGATMAGRGDLVAGVLALEAQEHVVVTRGADEGLCACGERLENSAPAGITTHVAVRQAAALRAWELA